MILVGRAEEPGGLRIRALDDRERHLRSRLVQHPGGERRVVRAQVDPAQPCEHGEAPAVLDRYGAAQRRLEVHRHPQHPGRDLHLRHRKDRLDVAVGDPGPELPTGEPPLHGELAHGAVLASSDEPQPEPGLDVDVGQHGVRQTVDGGGEGGDVGGGGVLQIVEERRSPGREEVGQPRRPGTGLDQRGEPGELPRGRGHRAERHRPRTSSVLEQRQVDRGPAGQGDLREAAVRGIEPRHPFPAEDRRGLGECMTPADHDRVVTEAGDQRVDGTGDQSVGGIDEQHQVAGGRRDPRVACVVAGLLGWEDADRPSRRRGGHRSAPGRHHDLGNTGQGLEARRQEPLLPRTEHHHDGERRWSRQEAAYCLAKHAAGPQRLATTRHRTGSSPLYGDSPVPSSKCRTSKPWVLTNESRNSSAFWKRR